MALLSFRGISTPSLPAQGEQRRSSYFNIPRGNSRCRARRYVKLALGFEAPSAAFSTADEMIKTRVTSDASNSVFSNLQG
jgi:hypothetical protein